MKRKLFSLFLAILMVVTAVPVTVLTVFAQDGAAGTMTEGEAMTPADAYKGLYVEGATATLLSYESTKDTVTLNGNGGGKWTNLIDGESYNLEGATDSYTVGAETHTLGWHFAEDGALTYDQTMANVMNGNKAHRISLPVSLLGDGYNTTVEFVAQMKPLDYSYGQSHRINTDVNGNGKVDPGDKFHCISSYIGLRNVAVCICYDAVYAEGYTAVPLGTSYKTYADSGRWNHQNAGQVASIAQNQNGGIRNLVIRESYSGDADAKVNYSATFFTDGDSHQGVSNGNSAFLSKKATTMVFAENAPANVYAIRVYQRTLNDAELLQNHFADLCAYFGADVSPLYDMDDEDRASVLSMLAVSAKDMTFTNTDANAINAIIESAAKALAARKYTDKLASLYVDGAKSLFFAYDSVSDVTVSSFGADRDAIWTNLIDGNRNAKIDSANKQMSGIYSYDYIPGGTYTNAGYTAELAYEFHTIEYDENDVPVAIRTVQLTHAKNAEGASYTNDKTNAIIIDGETYFLTNNTTTYRKLVPSTDGSKLYIKETDAKYVKKERVNYTRTDNGAEKGIDTPVYTTGTGEGKFTWTYLATEPTEGYTLLGEYKIGDYITGAMGGWELKNGGLYADYTDIMVAKNVTSKLDFGTMANLFGYAENAEYDYTLEIIMDYGASYDTDNFIFSASRTLYEGESQYMYGFQVGSLVEYNAVFAPEYTGVKDGIFNAHITWQYGAAKGYPVSNTNNRFNFAYNTKNLAGVVNLSYFKDGATVGLNANGAKKYSFVAGEQKYGDGTVSEYGPNYADAGVFLMQGIPGTVYAVRAYDFVLNAEQVAQNHFADLCAYFSLDVDALALLDADAKKDLYEEFSVYTFQNATKDELQALLDAETASISPLQYLGVAARLEDYAAIRGTFYYNTDMAESLTANGMQIIGYGAAVALADVGMSELTVSYDEKNSVTSDNAIAVISTLDGMSFNYENQDYGNIFTLAVTYGNVADTALKAAYETEILYRGFLILADEAGVTYVLYTNGTTDAYGDAASVKDVAESLLADPAYAENEILKGIVAVCEDEPLE